MSKIEVYNEAKSLSARMRSFADQVNPDQAHDSRHYTDKLGLEMEIKKTWAGSYGDSSSYSWSDDIKTEIARQISMDLRAIIENAARRREAITEEKRKAAQDEAREVLAETMEAGK